MQHKMKVSVAGNEFKVLVNTKMDAGGGNYVFEIEKVRAVGDLDTSELFFYGGDEGYHPLDEAILYQVLEELDEIDREVW